MKLEQQTLSNLYSVRTTHEWHGVLHSNERVRLDAARHLYDTRTTPTTAHEDILPSQQALRLSCLRLILTGIVYCTSIRYGTTPRNNGSVLLIASPRQLEQYTFCSPERAGMSQQEQRPACLL